MLTERRKKKKEIVQMKSTVEDSTVQLSARRRLFNGYRVTNEITFNSTIRGRARSKVMIPGG